MKFLASNILFPTWSSVMRPEFHGTFKLTQTHESVIIWLWRRLLSTTEGHVTFCELILRLLLVLRRLCTSKFALGFSSPFYFLFLPSFRLIYFEIITRKPQVEQLLNLRLGSLTGSFEWKESGRILTASKFYSRRAWTAKRTLIELLADTYSGAMLPVPAIHEATSFIYLEKIHWLAYVEWMHVSSWNVHQRRCQAPAQFIMCASERADPRKREYCPIWI